MPLESAGRSEFTEFVANHVFSYIDRQETAAIVDTEVKSDKVRCDGRTARPCRDRFAIIVGLRDFDFFREVRVDKKTFFDGT